METKRRCFYQVFGGSADFWDRRYDCPKCLPDDLNIECRHYKPVSLFVFEVPERKRESIEEELTETA